MDTFRGYTIIVLIVLAVVFGMAWFFTPREHFIRVSLICYGYLLGWLSAWLASRRYKAQNRREWEEPPFRFSLCTPTPFQSLTVFVQAS
jgi:disulfide bond formation protein DsbB